MNDEQRYRAGLVPITIGVTGHRDLVDAERAQIRQRVEALFTSLQQRFPDRPLRVLSPLAEGADQLVAEVAMRLGLHLTAVLPMPLDLYARDFQCEDSHARFEHLCTHADEMFELPVIAGLSREQLLEPGEARNQQYAQLGVFLCAHSHILLALWDGKPSVEMGGTAQVIQFHHYDTMTGHSSADDVSQQILADDDSDLVYQIVVSRQREGGKPRADLTPLETFWLTTDEHEPRSDELPEKYVQIFDRTSEFNRDVRKHAQSIVAGSYPLVSDKTAGRLPSCVHRINQLFCAADWLAIHYQRRFIRSLKLAHLLIFVMAMMVLLYSDVAWRQQFMIAFAVCLMLALGLQTAAGRGRWHSKYLEFRTLAEGLRVQFYWAAAGVTSGSITKYAHDNFLQKQDIELAWIRNVMRVAGIACDAEPNHDPAGLAFVLEEWIGEETKSGQLKYYRSKASEYLARDGKLEDLGKVLGVVVLALMASAVLVPSDDLRQDLFVVLGVLLLILSVREAYAYRVAEKEVIRQYEFMHRIFRNAKRRLADASTDFENRRILRLLGEAALDEHAEWILLHRERPLRKSQLWRMEG